MADRVLPWIQIIKEQMYQYNKHQEKIFNFAFQCTLVKGFTKDRVKLNKKCEENFFQPTSKIECILHK